MSRIVSKENCEAEKQRFISHLERASEIVSSWPSWKQTVLNETLALNSAAEVNVVQSCSAKKDGRAVKT